MNSYTCPACGQISYSIDQRHTCPHCDEEQLICRRCGATEGIFNSGFCADCWKQMALAERDIKLNIKNERCNGHTIEFCCGEKEYRLNPGEEIQIEIKDGDCMYFDEATEPCQAEKGGEADAGQTR